MGPDEFQSQLSRDEAVSRLAATLEPGWLLLPTKNMVVGEVSRDRVRLRFWRAWGKNWAAPQFVGRFVQRLDAVYLTGSFSWPWQMKIQVIGLGAIAALSVIWCIATLVGWDSAKPFPVAPFMALGGLLVGSVFLWIYCDLRGSSDTAALSMAIRNALAQDSPKGTR